MAAFHTVFVDECLWGQTRGFRTIDHSRLESDPERVFWLKVMLLFWVGDYPGLAKCSGFIHAGGYACHWCEGYFYPHSPGHNVCVHDRRNLRDGHPFRKDPRWGPHEVLPPNTLRSHEGVEKLAHELSAMEEGKDLELRKKQCGIREYCALGLLYLFDIVWDMMPDMMHIVKGTPCLQ
jgi:hypothetical protein